MQSLKFLVLALPLMACDEFEVAVDDRDADLEAEVEVRDGMGAELSYNREWIELATNSCSVLCGTQTIDDVTCGCLDICPNAPFVEDGAPCSSPQYCYVIEGIFDATQFRCL